MAFYKCKIDNTSSFFVKFLLSTLFFYIKKSTNKLDKKRDRSLSIYLNNVKIE